MAHLNTTLHVYVTVWEDLHNTVQMFTQERGRDFLYGDDVFCCERESTLFGLPKEDTRNQWLSCIYNTVPEQFNPNISVCAVHFTEDYFLNLAE